MNNLKYVVVLYKSQETLVQHTLFINNFISHAVEHHKKMSPSEINQDILIKFVF